MPRLAAVFQYSGGRRSSAGRISRSGKRQVEEHVGEQNAAEPVDREGRFDPKD
jgi:hypothetical protein